MAEGHTTHTRSPGAVVLAFVATLAVALFAAGACAVLVGTSDVALDLAAGGAAVGVLALLLRAASRPPTLEVEAVAGQLRVRFYGWDVVWSLRRELRIPLQQVQSAQVHRPESLWSGWWRRRLGTVVPGTIKAGWFAGPGGRELWDVRAGADVLDVRLSPPSPVSRLVLQVPDPAAAAHSLALAAHDRRE